MPEDRRLAAIMFTDIVGYTKLMGADEDQAFRTLKINREIHQQQLAKFNGTLIKEMGDGMLISFPSAMNAVKCAMAIQEEARMENIPLKIGIHEADVVFEGGDILGDGVNIASRIQERAEEGSIHISGAVYRDIKNKGAQTSFIEERTYKNVDEPIKVYRVLIGYEKVPEIKAPSPPGDNTLLQGKKVKIIRVVAGIFVVVLAVILVWQLIGFKKTIPQSEELERSIAVLPLNYLSEDPNKEYLAGGVLDAITGYLSKIEGLRVMPRTSVEQYRETKKTSQEIGEELDVSYLVEGSFQMVGDQVKLIIQLVIANSNDHLYFNEYNRDYKDILNVQSELAQTIAKEIGIALSPEEKEELEVIPTTNLEAYDFFIRAREEHTRYWLDNNNASSLHNAKILYSRALEYDTGFAQAYTGLAWVYMNENQVVHGSYEPSYLEEDFMDSALVLVNKALSLNSRLDEAYYLKGLYLAIAKSDIDLAIEALNQAISINPNFSLAYRFRGYMFIYVLGKYLEGLKDIHKAISLDHSPLLPNIIRNLAWSYWQAGFPEKTKFYLKEAMQLDNDSSGYLYFLSVVEYQESDINTRLKLDEKNYKSDPTNISQYASLISLNIILGNFNEAYLYAKEVKELLDSTGTLGMGLLNRIGHAYWLVGKKEEANQFFDEQIKYCLESIRLKRPYGTAGGAYYDLVCIYAFLGEKDKAYNYLDNSINMYISWWFRDFIKIDPMLESLRNDERFQRIVQKKDSNFKYEHERVKAWLEEEGMI